MEKCSSDSRGRLIGEGVQQSLQISHTLSSGRRRAQSQWSIRGVPVDLVLAEVDGSVLSGSGEDDDRAAFNQLLLAADLLREVMSLLASEVAGETVSIDIVSPALQLRVSLHVFV